MGNNLSANRVISGTWGQLWLDGELMAEVYKFQAKSAFTKDEVKLCGQMAVDSKITNTKKTGSVGMYKVNSRLIRALATQIDEGHDPRFVIISNLADPDSYGAERICVSNVSFDDLTMADWEAGVSGKIEAPFTFTEQKFLDLIGG